MENMLKEAMIINGLTIANRLVIPPMASGRAELNGDVGDKLVAYYEKKAAGGHIGLIITEHCYVRPEGQVHRKQISMARDEDIAGHQRLAAAVHAQGSSIFAQISHSGASTETKVTNLPILAVSADQKSKEDEPVTELTLEDIRALKDAYVQAALRVKAAGYDGVELHGAHGYLLNQFFSPLTNHRTDAYGGATLENRARFMLEVTAAVREAIGKDFPLAVRLGACDYTDGGITLEEGVWAAKKLEEAGADLLDISGGIRGFLRPDHTEPGYFAELTEAIKKEVSVPVILTGGVTTGAEAEALLQSGVADMIGVGRCIWKNNRWAEEAMTEN